MNESVNDEAVCRTASATPGLLKRTKSQSRITMALKAFFLLLSNFPASRLTLI